MKTYLINQMLTTRRVEEIFINKDNKCWYLDVKISFDGSAYSLDDDYSIIIFGFFLKFRTWEVSTTDSFKNGCKYGKFSIPRKKNWSEQEWEEKRLDSEISSFSVMREKEVDCRRDLCTQITLLGHRWLYV